MYRAVDLSSRSRTISLPLIFLFFYKYNSMCPSSRRLYRITYFLPYFFYWTTNSSIVMMSSLLINGWHTCVELIGFDQGNRFKDSIWRGEADIMQNGAVDLEYEVGIRIHASKALSHGRVLCLKIHILNYLILYILRLYY